MSARFLPASLQGFLNFGGPSSAPPRNKPGSASHLTDYMLKDIGLTRQDAGPLRHKW